MIERDFLTEEEVLALLWAMGRPRPSEAPTLEAMPPETRWPQKWSFPERDLEIAMHKSEAGIETILSGGDSWRGALVHCRWEWFDATQPERKVEESLTALALVPEEQDPWGRYSVRIMLPEDVASCPAVGHIVPRYADPKSFLDAWRAARVRPTVEELQKWIQAHQDEFPPRHRDRWLELPQEL